MIDVSEAAERIAAGHDIALPIRIETQADVFTFPCDTGETILGAGLAAGYALPYECATGTCGTCRARVMDGSVDPGWVEAPGYRKLKRDKGDVLMCQARPLDACVLRVATNVRQPERPVPTALRRQGRIVASRRLTRDTIEFEVALSQPMTFGAGQFVTLRHQTIDGARAYSMANFVKSAKQLTFVVKRKPGGRFSDLIVAGGGDLEIIGPLGRATFRPEEGRDLLCIAGGSGIAGIMAMLQHAADERYFAGRHLGHVFFGLRTLQDAFYLEQLATHVASSENSLTVTVAVSDEPVSTTFHPDFPALRLAHGLTHEVAAAAKRDTWTNATAFVAGPRPMVDATVGMLVRAGVGAQNIRFDKFS